MSITLALFICLLLVFSYIIFSWLVSSIEKFYTKREIKINIDKDFYSSDESNADPDNKPNDF